MLDPNGLYFEYLRKSREDRDAELRGEGETLARHAQMLEDLSNKLHIRISRVFKEVVSGETIAARPEMLNMLSAIESEKPDGVLVVEIERLARGDTRDQGLIMETFKYAGTKIITPLKTYDPNDESDEEYAEFGLFMSRREYKTINRRLQRGRRASVNEGKWTSNVAPYGFSRIKIPNAKGWTLKVLPEEARTVNFMAKLLLTGAPESDNKPVGIQKIAHILDDLGIKPRHADHWQPTVISSILTNYANIGKLQVGKRKQKKEIVNGVVRITRPTNNAFEIIDGLFEGIMDEDTFYQIQSKLKESFRPMHTDRIKWPLAGLVYCSQCKKSMQRRPEGVRNKGDTLMCKTHGCPTVGSFCNLVEERLLIFLENWLKDYKIHINEESTDDWSVMLQRKQHALSLKSEESETLQKQLNNIFDYFEQGIYSVELFQQRRKDLEEKQRRLKTEIDHATQEIQDIEKRIRRKEEFIPFFENVLHSYYQTENPTDKNALLKQIVEHVEYTKTKKGTPKGDGVDGFELDVYLKL